MYPQVRSVLACRLVEQEYIVVVEKDGGDHALVLNHAASRAFSLMDGTRSLDDIAEVLASDCGAEPAEMRRGLDAVAAELAALGVIVRSERRWATPAPVRLQGCPPLAARAEPAILESQPLQVVAGTCASLPDGTSCWS